MLVTEYKNKLHRDTKHNTSHHKCRKSPKPSFFSHHCNSANIKWLGAETAGEIHAVVQHLRADGAWEEDHSIRLVRGEKKRDIFPAMERCSGGSAALTGQDYCTASCYTGSRSPSDVRHHLLQEQDLMWSCSGAPAGELRDCLRRKSTMEAQLTQLRCVI